MRASDKAYAALRDDIIEWRLLPGTVLAQFEQFIDVVQGLSLIHI